MDIFFIVLAGILSTFKNKSLFYLLYITIKKFLLNRNYIKLALTLGFLTAIISSFNTAAPFIFHNVFHFNYRKIAFFLAIPNMAMVIGLLFAIVVNITFCHIIVIRFSIIIILVCTIIMAGTAAFNIITVTVIMLPIIGIGFAIGLITPFYWTEALLPFTTETISAAAFIIFIQNILGVLATVFISIVPERSHFPLASIIFILAVFSIILYPKFKR